MCKKSHLESPRRKHLGFSTILRFLDRGCKILTCGLNLFITCKHSLLWIFALTYSAYCSSMSGIKVFFGTFVKPKQGGVVRTLFHFRRWSTATISVNKFLSTNFHLWTTSGDICTLMILIHCLRCARMNELKRLPRAILSVYKAGDPQVHCSNEISTVVFKQLGPSGFSVYLCLTCSTFATYLFNSGRP